MSQPPTEQLVTLKEIAWRLGLSYWTVSRRPNQTRLGLDRYRVEINPRLVRFKPTVWLFIDRKYGLKYNNSL